MAFKVPKQKAIGKKSKATPPALQPPPQPAPELDPVVRWAVATVHGQEVEKPKLDEVYWRAARGDLLAELAFEQNKIQMLTNSVNLIESEIKRIKQEKEI